MSKPQTRVVTPPSTQEVKKKAAEKISKTTKPEPDKSEKNKKAEQIVQQVTGQGVPYQGMSGAKKPSITTTTTKTSPPIATTSNWDALKKGVSGLTDIPDIVSSGVQQTWNDPDIRQGTKNAVVSVVAQSPLGPFRILYNWIPGVPEFKADKETEDALLKISIVKIGSPSTAVKVKNWVERIKNFFTKK